MVAGGAGLTYSHPLLLCLLIIAVWGLVARRRPLLVTAIAGIFLLAWPPVAWVGAQVLEAWYSPKLPAADLVQAIVVLAAGAAPAEAPDLAPSLKENTYLRCQHALAIWKRNPRLPMLLCGGTEPGLKTSLASIMRRMMAEQGVPESMLWTEDNSTSTYENALFGTRILRQKGVQRIILVTEAYHMLRSERCFRKQGIVVIPAACNFAHVGGEPNSVLPVGGGILLNEQTLHELVGLSWYLVKGRI